jgi:hypothetical protein
VSVLSLILATLCSALADGDGAVIFTGVLAAASGLLGLATFFLRRKPRFPLRTWMKPSDRRSSIGQEAGVQVGCRRQRPRVIVSSSAELAATANPFLS